MTQRDKEASKLNILFFMESLANLSEQNVSQEKIINAFGDVLRKKGKSENDNITYKNLHFSIQHLSVIEAIKNVDEGIRRLSIASIPSWYYGMYYAARALLSAHSDGQKDSHKSIANAFAAEHICDLLLFPFNLRINIYDIQREIEENTPFLKLYMKIHESSC